MKKGKVVEIEVAEAIEAVEIIEAVAQIEEIAVAEVEASEDRVFKSKSEQIRVLKFEMGMKNSEIAKLMNIRDQFVSNVVRKAIDEKRLKELENNQ